MTIKVGDNVLNRARPELTGIVREIFREPGPKRYRIQWSDGTETVCLGRAIRANAVRRAPAGHAAQAVAAIAPPPQQRDDADDDDNQSVSSSDSSSAAGGDSEDEPILVGIWKNILQMSM